MRRIAVSLLVLCAVLFGAQHQARAFTKSGAGCATPGLNVSIGFCSGGGGGGNNTVLDGAASAYFFSGTSGTISFPGTSQGSGLIVVTAIGTSSAAVTSVTATGLTFTLRTANTVNSSQPIYVYTAPYSSNVPSENITINFSGTPNGGSAAFGIGKALTSGSFDGSAVNGGLVGPGANSSITTANQYDFVYLVANTGNSSDTISGTGFTDIRAISGNPDYIAVGYAITTVTGTYSAGSTVSGSYATTMDAIKSQ